MTTTQSIKAIKKFKEVINDYIEYGINRINFSSINLDPHHINSEAEYREQLITFIMNVLFVGYRPDLFNDSFSWFINHRTNYKPTALAYHAVICSVKVIITEIDPHPQEALCDLIKDTQFETMNTLAYWYHLHMTTYSDKLNQFANDMFIELKDKTRTTGKECVICYDDCVIAHICQTCKHSMVCKQCYSRLNNQCPLCRTTMVIPNFARIGTWRIKVNHLHTTYYKPEIGGSYNYYCDTLEGIREYDIKKLKRTEIKIGHYSYMENRTGEWIVKLDILDKHKCKRNRWGNFEKKTDYHHTMDYHNK